MKRILDRQGTKMWSRCLWTGAVQSPGRSKHGIIGDGLPCVWRQTGHKDVVALLLGKGAATISSGAFNDGLIALHHAAVIGHQDVVTLLLDKGVEFSWIDG